MKLHKPTMRNFRNAEESPLTFETVLHRVAIASALGLLLIASPSNAQAVAAATEEFSMTSQLQ